VYIHVLYKVQRLNISFVFQILQLAFEDHARASTPDTQVDDDPLPAESSSPPASCTTDDDPVPSPPATTAKMVSKKLQANLKPPQRTRIHQSNSKITGCTQTIVSYKTVSTQTHQDDQHINADSFTKHVEDEDDNYSDGDDDDDDYQATYDESSTDNDDDDCEVQQMNHKLGPDSSPLDKKQIVVSESALYQILSVCQYCCSETTHYIQYTKGTLISTSVCINGHISMWKSEPSHKSMPWSNLMTATAIMCSGVNAAKALKMFEHMNLQMFSSRTYTSHCMLHHLLQ